MEVVVEEVEGDKRIRRKESQMSPREGEEPKKCLDSKKGEGGLKEQKRMTSHN
jgi:hypothetical protein